MHTLSFCNSSTPRVLIVNSSWLNRSAPTHRSRDERDTCLGSSLCEVLTGFGQRPEGLTPDPRACGLFPHAFHFTHSAQNVQRAQIKCEKLFSSLSLSVFHPGGHEVPYLYDLICQECDAWMELSSPCPLFPELPHVSAGVHSFLILPSLFPYIFRFTVKPLSYFVMHV